MKILVYAHAEHQKAAANLFSAGLRRHGINGEVRLPAQYEKSDIAVLWGIRRSNITLSQKRAGCHYLVMERGYIGDRFQWTSLGFDGLNGRATFPKIDDGLARWNRHFAQYMKPWRQAREERTAVIMGQVRSDMACRRVNFQQWVENQQDVLRSKKFEKIFLRLHPGDQKLHVPGVEEINGALENALNAASLVVTYNSNSGVDAVMAGVPVYAEDAGSMVFGLSNRDYKPVMRDRTNWCKYMAYTQWLPAEIESGEAWEALKKVTL